MMTLSDVYCRFNRARGMEVCDKSEKMLKILRWNAMKDDEAMRGGSFLPFLSWLIAINEVDTVLDCTAAKHDKTASFGMRAKPAERSHPLTLLKLW